MVNIRLLPDVSSFLSEFEPASSPHPHTSVMLAPFVIMLLLVHARDTYEKPG